MKIGDFEVGSSFYNWYKNQLEEYKIDCAMKIQNLMQDMYISLIDYAGVCALSGDFKKANEIIKFLESLRSEDL